MEFCLLGASSATLSLSSCEVGSSCSGFTHPRLQEGVSQHSSTVTRAEGRDRCSPGAPLGASVREHRTQNITGEGTQCDVGKCRGRALQGLGNCSNHKAVLSPHTHTEIVHSNQCGRKCLQDLSCEQLIINNSWTARRALGVTL